MCVAGARIADQQPACQQCADGERDDRALRPVCRSRVHDDPLSSPGVGAAEVTIETPARRPHDRFCLTFPGRSIRCLINIDPRRGEPRGYGEQMRDWAAPRLPLRWSSADQPPLIGREVEIAELQSAWADCAAGRGRAVFVGGDPGVGKSRLVGEVCVHLHELGAVVLVGTCVPEFGAPYEPFLEPLRTLLPLVTGRLQGAGRQETIRYLRALTGGEVDPPAVSGQVRLYEAVVEAFRAAAEIHPLVVVLEDLQWADVATVRLLSRVVEATIAHRLLMIGTERTAAPDASVDLTDAVSRLGRLAGTRRIDLTPFGEAEISMYLMRRTGMTQRRSAEPARVLFDLTGGNPFLVRETWARVLAAVENGTRRVDMPETVHDLLRAPITALDARSRRVLQYAAVLGQDVDLGELIAVSETAREQTLEGVDAAVSLGLLEPPRQASDLYRFPHAIARQAVIDTLGSTQVTRMHAKIALVLEEQFPSAPRIVQRLAHHFEAARSLGYRDRAVIYLERAGERGADCATTMRDADALRLRAARCWIGTADFARARQIREVVAVEGSSTYRVAAAIAFEEATWRPGLPGARAAEVLRAAADHADPEVGADQRIRCDAALGRSMVRSGDFERGQGLIEKAIDEARRLGDSATIAFALRASVTSTLRPTTLERSRARAVEAGRLWDGSVDDLAHACAHFRGTSSYIVGDLAGIELAEAMLQEAAHRSGAYWHYGVACIRFVRRLSAGRLEDAAAAQRLARLSEQEFKSDFTLGASALQSYMVRREEGSLDRIASHISGDEALDEHWAPGLLALYTELEMSAPARKVMVWLLDRVSISARDSGDWPAQLSFLVDAAVWLEDQESAARIRPWVQEYSGMNLLAGHFIAPFGSADRCLGAIDSLCGAGDPERSFAAALEMDRRMDAALHVALTWAAVAAHRRRAGAGESAVREAVDAGWAIAEPAGLVRILRLLRGPAEGVRPKGPDGLTAREIEVIGLLAQGLTNKELAARLVLSEHTVANHVRSILFKTRAENRTQAAMYARERGLV